MPNTSISIVVPAFNRASTLRQTLAALTTQDYVDYEIIIIDDGSTDDTREMIAQYFPAAIYWRQENRGPAAARNRGIERAHGEIIAFTDDDCVPPRDWLARLADGYARYPQVAGVGGYQEPPTETLAKNLYAQYEMFIARHYFHVSDQEYCGAFECPAGGTNNMSYRREILERVGRFDESFRYAAGEDADLKWRICKTGAQLLFLPVPVLHLHAYTTASFQRQSFTRGKGKARFDIKYAGANRVLSLGRLVRRWAMLPLDVRDERARQFMAFKFSDAWHNFRGEWAMLAEMRRWKSST